jgi:hypothetical protein
MKIFGYKFRQFQEDPTTVEAVEVWCVKWLGLYHAIADHWHTNKEVVAFQSKADAEVFAKELKSAAKLLKNTHQRVEIYKQDYPNNL